MLSWLRAFKIIDGISNAATREVMEKNVNELITIINGAYEAKQKKTQPFASGLHITYCQGNPGENVGFEQHAVS